MGGMDHAARRKLITAARQRRYRMAVAYLNRRRDSFKMTLYGQQYLDYLDWVDAFPKFMVIAYPGAILRQREHDARQVRKAGDYSTAATCS